MTKPMIGTEVEIFRYHGRVQFLDPNVGKVGGAKRFLYPLLHDNLLSDRVMRLARSVVDTQNDSYIISDHQTGIKTFEGRPFISPFLHAVKSVIEERGYRCLGLILRNGLSRLNPKHWHTIDMNENGEMLSDEYSSTRIEALRDAPAVHLGCHFAPKGCQDNQWDENTRRNGLVNNVFDLPGVSPWFLHDFDNTPYKHAVIYYPETKFPDHTPDVPHIRGLDALAQLFKQYQSDGFTYAALKKTNAMSLGGARVKFAPLAGINALDRIDVPTFISPYYAFDVNETPQGPAVIQTRVLYSKDNNIRPEIVCAKIYPCPDPTQPANFSEYCPHVYLWDLGDNLWHIEAADHDDSRPHQHINIERIKSRDARAFASILNDTLTQALSPLSALEHRLSDIGSTYASAHALYERRKTDKLVPPKAKEYLRNFLR